MTDLDSAVHVPCTDVLVRVAKRVMQDEQDKTTRLSQLREAMHVKGYNTIDYGYKNDFDFVEDHEGCCWRLERKLDTVITLNPATGTSPQPQRAATPSASSTAYAYTPPPRARPSSQASARTPPPPQQQQAPHQQQQAHQQQQQQQRQRSAAAPQQHPFHNPLGGFGGGFGGSGLFGGIFNTLFGDDDDGMQGVHQPHQQQPPRPQPQPQPPRQQPQQQQQQSGLIGRARSLEELEELVEVLLDPSTTAEGIPISQLEKELGSSLVVLTNAGYRTLIEFLKERKGLAQLLILDRDTKNVLVRPVATAEHEACAMCLSSGRFARFISPCSHRFHLVCIREWVERDPTCPVCRLAIPQRMIPR